MMMKYCIPHLLKAENPQILTLSPPYGMSKKWFASNLPYTMAKYGMTLCTMGASQEFDGKIGASTLWPRTLIVTDAVRYEIGD